MIRLRIFRAVEMFLAQEVRGSPSFLKSFRNGTAYFCLVRLRRKETCATGCVVPMIFGSDMRSRSGIVLTGRSRMGECCMTNYSMKGALICAVLPFGLMTSGCMGVGEAGLHDAKAGNWSAAKVEFAEDYRDNPGHPIAVFNMGTAYSHDGDGNKAASMYSEAATRGRGYVPDLTLEPINAGDTVAEHACARLHRDNKLDANCGDQIAIVTPPAPPPAPVAQAAPEPAPAVEAEATTVPPPKQDRN
jgi:hypothetical protein